MEARVNSTTPTTAMIAVAIGSALLLGCQSPAGAKAAKSGPRLPVIYNLDLSQFYVGTFGPVVPETIDTFVDAHAAVGVTDWFINVSGQRTNYRSDVWESYWDGYDPKLGPEQPFFNGIEPRRRAGPDADDTQFYINTYRLYMMGCDYPQRMIDRARRNHMRPWISLRMNDSHNSDSQDHPIHSTFWKQHPEWRLSNGALDYERPEVRERQMQLIKEICSRYDVDGIELDYERFWLYFRPGREHEGARLMTAFVEEARTHTDAAAKRWKHPVKLAVRVPTTPWIARRHGLDTVAWGKAGLVDLIIASPFWFSLCSDIPIETWKGMLIGTNVQVAFSQEDGINSGASGRRTATPEEVRGLIVSALQRGADAVYFFNLFTNPYQSWPRPEYNQLLTDSGSYAALCAAPRRHALTITHPWAAGEPGKEAYLPYTGTNGVFRIHSGPRPAPGQTARVELVMEGAEQPLEVRLNSAVCPSSGVAGSHRLYDVPAEALSDGYNLIEVTSKEPVTLTWVEISVR
jgi:hypothetical protein